MTYGLQASEMDRLVTACRTEADRIESVAAGLDVVLAQTYWQGADADRFRAAWASAHRIELGAVAQELTTISTTLRRELDDQIACSGS